MSEFGAKFLDSVGPVGTYEEKETNSDDDSLLKKIKNIDLSGIASSAYNAIENNLENNYNSDMYSGYNGFAEKMTNPDQPYVNPYGSNDTYAGSLTNSISNGIAGTIGGIADILHMDTLGNRMNQIADQSNDDQQISPEFSMDYITNPHGLTRSTGNLLGSMAALAPAAAFVPETAAAGLAGRLGGNRAVQALIDSGHYTAAKKLAQSLVNGTQWAATAVPEALSEGGGVRRDAIENGIDNPDLRAWETAGANLPLLTASKFLEGGLLGNGLLNISPRGLGTFGRVATAPARAIPTTLAESTQNGLEEVAQQGIQNAFTDKPYGVLPWNWTPDQAQAGEEGFAGSLLLGGLGGAAHAASKSGNAMNNSQERSDWMDGYDGEVTEPETVDLPQNIQDIIDAGNADNSSSSDAGSNENDKSYNISDEVSDTNITSGTEAKLRKLDSDFYNEFGEHLTTTSLKRNGNGNSWHDSGQAFDVAGGILENNQDARDWLMQRGQELGLTPLDEYTNPSEHATGGHIHFSNHEDDSSNTSAQSSGNSDYDGWINQYSSQYGVPTNLLYSLINTESGFNPNAVSDAGAIGIAQFMPDTAEEIGIDPTDPKQAIEGAAIYLRQKYDKHGDWHTALEAYNGGDGNIGSGETKAYADKVMSDAGNISSIRSNQQSIKPFELDGGDSNTLQAYDDFANYMKETSSDARTNVFFDGMFSEDRKGNDTFNNTPENRKAIADNFGSELKEFVNQNKTAENAPQSAPISPIVNSTNSNPINTVSTQNIDKAKAEQAKIVSQPPADNAAARKELGNKILMLAQGTGTNIEGKLAAGLRAGYAKAITTAQQRLSDAGIAVPAAEFIMNERGNNNVTSQSNEQAAPTQGIRSQNSNENAVSQQSSPAAEEGKVDPLSYRGTYADKTPDHDARYRGGIKNGVIDVWQSNFSKADSPLMSMSLDEVRQAADRYANSMTGIRELVKEKRDAAVGKWIDSSPNERVKEARRNNWENNTLTGKLSAIESRGIDSAVHVASHLYEQATGEKPMSGWEKRQNGKTATLDKGVSSNSVKNEENLKVSNNTGDKSAQNEDSAQWIANHRFSYDTSKSVDENIRIAEQMAQEYIDRFGTTDKINTPERDALRQNIVDRLYGNGANKKGNEVYLIIGLPASGKSTIADPLVKEHGAILIDSDEAKKLLPELSNGLLATAVHEESSTITKNVTRRAIINGDNIVMPIVGKTWSTLNNKIYNFKRNGYRVNLIYVGLPVNKAIERVKNRFKEEGRLVSPQYLSSVGLKPKDNYDRMKLDKGVDSYEAWNNDVNRGQRPILMEQGPSKSGMGRLRNERNGMGKPMGRSGTTPDGSSKTTARSEQLSHSDNQGGFSVPGNRTTVISDNGNEIKVVYKIVPADSLITSNSAKRGLAINPDYPKELQPRDRQRKSMEHQITEMSYNLRPRSLGESENLNEGAPIIRDDRVVLNGNGRTISVIRALKAAKSSNMLAKSAKLYYKFLVQNAEKFGIEKKNVLSMITNHQNPVLVREVVGDISSDMMQDIIGSTAGGSRMGASEQAKADAKKITIEALERYAENDNGDITTAANRDFVAGILYNVASKNDINALLDKNGNVNADGIQRVKRALFSLAYGDDDLISKMADSTDDNIRNVSNALLAAAPAVAKLNIKMRDGKAHSYELAKTITDATKRLDALRHEGKPVSTYLSEQSMFDGYQDTDEMRDVLKYFDENKRKSKKLAKFIERAVSAIDSMGDPNQESLIVTDKKTLRDVIRQSEGDVENGGQADLFMDEGRETGSNEVLQSGERERKEDVRSAVQERKAETDGAVHVHGRQVERTFTDKESADAAMMNEFGVNKDAVSSYRDKADDILKQFNSREINKSAAVQSLKDLMGEANQDFWDKKLSDDERKQAQSFANDAMGEINKQQAEKSKKRKAANHSGERRVFADKSTADEAMLKEFGIEKPAAKKSPRKRSWAHKTDEEKAALKAQISKEMGKISSLAMFNPKLMVPAFKLTAAYIDDGVVKFSEFSRKMVDDLGEKIRPWLKSMWNAAVSYEGDALDEGKLTMMLQSVGARYDDGMHTYKEIYDDISSLVGENNIKAMDPYIKSAFNSVEAYYNESIPAMTFEEVEENGTDGSTDRLAARAGEGNNQDTMGRYDESTGSEQGSIREGVQSSGTEVRSQRSVRVQDSSASAGGKAGNSGVQANKSADRTSGSGGIELSGSVRDSYERDTSLDDGREGRDITAPEIGRKHESDSLKTKSEPKAKAGSLEKSIEHDLPMLLPEQRGDVVFMERRLQENGKQGVMLTNGTGTGKTFSGMGIVKRMVSQGKKNILIVTPGSEINKQWIEAAKNFFGVDIHELENEQDAGKGVTITTYANYGANNELVNREWDMIIQDESQRLMENEKGEHTLSLSKLRALTYHRSGFRDRFKLLHSDEYKRLDDLHKKMKSQTSLSSKDREAIEAEQNDLYDSLNKEETAKEKEWEKIPDGEKPKVVMLSATPFSRVANIDYAEGYLFDYGDKQASGYNDPDAKEKFFIEHFGYRMRYNKLTKPDANVDNSLMEMNFYDWLKSTGAVTGRSIDIDADYERGFLLTPNAVGTLMDKGFDALHQDKYRELEEVISKAFDGRKRNYLLEYIKAKEVIPIIRQYLKQGKKVVVFHQAMKSTKVSNPFVLPENISYESNEQRHKVMSEYEAFRSEHPELYRNNMGMDNLLSPIDAIESAFGDKAGFYNGSSDAKRQVKDADGKSMDKRSRDVAEFNDDSSSKKVLLVQQDAGNAGISLHDVTGKHQRVLINLAIPKRPTYAIQTEGRIYRVGSKTNAIIRYLTTGTNLEKSLFASTVASRAGTAENLSMGSAARNLRDSFRDLYMETMDGTWESRKPGSKTEGIGGKAMDSAANDAITDFDKAKTYYYSQQKKTGKTKTAEGNDYFSTPEPVGLKMVEWAQTPKGGRILEPSAGHGAISRWFSPDTDQTIIEPSGHLAPLAQMVTPDAKLVHDTFENHNLVNKYDSVVMNPPFGSGGKTAIDHVAKAFKHLSDGGRLVAIIPDGPSCMKHLEKWLYGNPDAKTKAERGEETAVLMRSIRLPGVAFERAGTKVNTRIIIIDKQNTQEGRDAAAAEAGGEIELNHIDNINDLFDRMEHMDAPKRISSDDIVKKDSPVSDSESNFSSGDFVHTKTKENIPQAKPKEYLGDSYKPISSLAKKHGGYYSRYSKSFLFKDAASRDEFVKVADALLGDEKNSAMGPIEKMRSEITFPQDSELNKQQTGIMEFAKSIGCPVVFFDGDSRMNGFHSRNITFLNRKSATSLPWTFWHETLHWIANNNKKLFSDMVKHIKGKEAFSPEVLDKYREEVGQPWLSDDAVIEEMMADVMVDVKQRVSFMKDLGRQDASLAQRFVAWIKSMMDKFSDFLHSPVYGLTTMQKDAFQRAFANLARDMVDADGKRIFRASNRTHDIQLATGQALSTVKYSLDNSDNIGHNEGEKTNITKESKERIFHDVIKRMNGRVDYLKHNGKSLENIHMEFADENSPSREISLKTFKTYYNQFASPKANKRNLVERIRKISDLSDSEIEQNFDSFKRAAKEMLDYAGFIYKETSSYGRGSDGRFTGLSSWEEVERSNAEHGGTYRTGKTEAGMNEKRSDNQGAFSMGKSEDETKYSISKQDQSIIQKAQAKLAKKMKLGNDKVEVRETVNDSNGMNPWRRYVMSPSRIAAKVPQFKLFFEYANRAMNKLTALRSDYARKLDSAMQLVKNKDDRKSLYELLAQGDAEGKEYTQEELSADGVNDNVAQAYKQVRQLMTKAYIMLNDARRRVQTKTEHASSKRINELKNNKFVDILRINENEDGSQTVTYKEAGNWKRNYDGISADALDLMKKDDAMQILSEQEAGVDEDGNKLYNVETRESIPDIHKRGGYIPHFFHEYMVRIREKNSSGDMTYRVVGSGRTVREAVKVANAYAKKNNIGDDAKLVVSPKVFDFSSLGMDESQYAAVMGDNDYKRMVKTLAIHNDLTLPEAREMVQGAAKMKNRHRFFGNFLQRKGAEGYENDMDWVLRHYFNSACRYTALETEFKPKAISLFERIHGDFNKEYKGVAQYTKEYINDINGVPSAMEDSINTMLNNNIFWRRMVASRFGDRAALQLANIITNKVSILKLGFLNASSALINFTQAANAAAYIGDPKVLYRAIMKGAHRKYTMHDLRILHESGVMNDIGLDSGSGYGKFSAGKWASRSMILFKTSEGIIRRGTVLAAYQKGIERGMSHKQAIEFAKDVNRKSNFDYGVHDAPNMFRRGSIISQLLLQFKKYPVKELEVMRDMLPLFSNSTSAKQKALFWGTYFMMAGLCQVPFGDWWDDFAKMFGISPKSSFKKGLMEWAGNDPAKKEIAKIMMYGAGSVAGIDISSRTCIADVLPTKISDALGPTVSTLKQLLQADGSLQRLRALSPGLANIVMAAEGKSLGARGRVGSEYNTAYDRVLRALGFRSTDEAIESDIQSITYDQRSSKSKDKQKAVDDYLENPTTQNATRLRELGVKPETVKKERERKKMDKLGRTKDSMTKDEQKANKGLLDFAK